MIAVLLQQHARLLYAVVQGFLALPTQTCLLYAGMGQLNSRQLLKTLLGLGELTSLNMQNQPDLTDDTLRAVSTLAEGACVCQPPYCLLAICCCKPDTEHPSHLRGTLSLAQRLWCCG